MLLKLYMSDIMLGPTTSVAATHLQVGIGTEPMNTKIDPNQTKTLYSLGSCQVQIASYIGLII